MKIVFGLFWGRSQKNVKKAFRLPGSSDMYEFYMGRMKKHFPNIECELYPSDKILTKNPGDKLWLCERMQIGAKNITSEVLSEKIEEAKVSGTSKLYVVIGPPDGFTEEEIRKMAPDFLWSFGKGTYPHELAAIIMMEQVYRALTILDSHPYHLGH